MAEILKKLKRLIKLRMILNMAVLLGLFSVPLMRNVYADNFYPGGDVADCNMSFTSALQINSLPLQNTQNGISYDANQVKGVSNNWIQSHKFTDTGTYLFPDAHRYPEIASEVSVPPNSKIDIGLFYANFAGHNVDIRPDSVYFLSKDNSDVTKVLTGNYSDLSASWKAFGQNYQRSGKGFNFGGYTISSSEHNGNGRITATLNTIQPLIIVSRTISTHFDATNLILHFTNVIRNQSSYALNNVEVNEYDPFTGIISSNNKVNFSPGELKTIEYEVNVGNNYPLSFKTKALEIIDPNYHTESMVETGPFSDKNSLNAFVDRNDSGVSNWFRNQSITSDSGKYGDYLKVTLLPYKVYSDQQTIPLTIDYEIKKSVNKEVAKPGDILTYNIHVANNNARIDNFVIADTLDNNLELVSTVPSGVIDGNKIKWNIKQLQHGESLNLIINAKVKKDVTDKTVIRNISNITVNNSTKNSNEVQTRVEIPIVLNLVQPTPIPLAPTLPETGINMVLQIITALTLITLILVLRYIPKTVYIITKSIYKLKILSIKFHSLKINPFRIVVDILPVTIFLLIVFYLPVNVFAATSVNADVAPFWKGIKSLINIMRYLVGGIALVSLILIGIQKVVSIILPSNESSTSSKLIGLVAGLGIVMFAPEIIKLIAEIFDKKIELPI